LQRGNIGSHHYANPAYRVLFPARGILFGATPDEQNYFAGIFFDKKSLWRISNKINFESKIKAPPKFLLIACLEIEKNHLNSQTSEALGAAA